MSVEGMDKDLLDTLTPEERAAIEDTEYSPEELAAMQGVAGEDGDDENEGEGDDLGSGNEPPVVADAGEAKDDTSVVVEEPAAAPARTTAYKAELPSDYNDQVSALKDQTRALADKFKAGDIEFEDYQVELDKLNEKRDELADLRIKATISEEMTSQSIEQQWTGAVEKFVSATAKVEGIDYKTDTEKQSDLDTFVKSLAANPKNADKSFDWFLTEAHKRVKALHGIPDKKVDPPRPDPKPASRKPPVDSVPKTLAQVPGGDGAGDVGGEFADIDSLDGMELEMALAKMTPAQRERYQRGE